VNHALILYNLFMLKLYHSYKRKLEDFKPINKDLVGLYTCGPTVYNFAHIGNLRTFLFDDLLRRALEYNGYEVMHVMNITDVGHLTSDSDAGEDKLEKGAKREGRTVWEVAEFYTQAFLQDLKKLNIAVPNHLPKATGHIKEQISLIEKLIANGNAYVTDHAVYFNVKTFPRYEELTGQNLDEKQTGRDEVVHDDQKRNYADFALWFMRKGRFENHAMHWPSPWGEGFPGWHIECSAMSVKYLGQPFDIHASGIDHFSLHHPNEIAQSEAAFNKPLANYWLHSEHLLIDEGKMSKSEGNFITLTALEEKKFDPLSFRYLTLSAHYRSKLNFTFKGLLGAQNALNNLYNHIIGYKEGGKTLSDYKKRFDEAINNDLSTPSALAIAWELIRSNESGGDKLATIFDFDKIFGLKLKETFNEWRNIPPKVSELLKKREEARSNKDYGVSDDLRKEIESLGYSLDDSPSGPRLKKIV
jgi:cysteinyl-tRNA synthetase